MSHVFFAQVKPTSEVLIYRVLSQVPALFSIGILLFARVKQQQQMMIDCAMCSV